MTAVACNKSEPEEPPLINDYVSGIQVIGDVSATSEVINQQLGEGSEDGPQAETESTATVVNGGSVQETITAAAPFSKLRVALEPLSGPGASLDPGADPTAVPTQPSTGVPAKGYHEISLDQESTEVTIVVTVQQTLPGQRFLFYFAVVDGSGKQGKLTTQDIEAVTVGTGDVQVSVSWDTDSDVDLHVLDPTGEEVYYGTPEVTSGGQLDLDSNADCAIDGVNNENVTWQDAPPGTYEVRVDLYRGCDATPTNYVVTIQVVGQPTKTYTGTLTGEGDLGGEGDGQLIASFEVPETETQTT
jgi:hypothetical protein